MIDPLAEMVALLQPSARFSKVVRGGGAWRVRRSEVGESFYCAILEGSCLLQEEDRRPIELREGDFVLIPSPRGFTVSSREPVATSAPDAAPVQLLNGEFRLGGGSGPHDILLLVGHCAFGSPDAGLLISLLPRLVHVRGEKRLATLVELLGDESRKQRPAREAVLSRLLEVLLIEALRSMADTDASPGLVRALGDERLAIAIRRMHQSPTRAWTVAQLAKEAGLSRSAFFRRFNRAVGKAPMEYLLAWRMALAKELLRRREGGIAEVAERVGYGSASAFSVAFTRHVGQPPTSYARQLESPAAETSM